MDSDEFPEKDHWGRQRTPYAVHCEGPFDLPGNGHGLVYLSTEEYNIQMDRPNSLWKCPICKYDATWSNSNYEEMMANNE